MLSELSDDFDAILRGHGGRTTLEYKYDGARVQIHKPGDQVRIWSRRLTEVTSSLPEIVERVNRETTANSAIFDGEVVAMRKEGRPYPFQELMRRFRRMDELRRRRSIFHWLYSCLIVCSSMAFH